MEQKDGIPYSITIQREGEQLIKKLKKLKPDFEKLSYSDKLTFWDENELDYHETTYFFIDGEHRNEPKNHISIFPKTEDEYQHYFAWHLNRLARYSPLQYDLVEMKEHYFNTINENPQPIYYTKTELDKYKKVFENHFNELPEKKTFYSQISNSYKKGFNSVAKNEMIKFENKDFTYNHCSVVAEGFIAAYFISFLDEQLGILDEEKKNPKNKGKVQLEKIKWTGKPSQLGYIVSQLVGKGFIELPTTRGEGSYARLAKLFMQYFEVNNEKGNPTTEQNLEKEFNPNKNTLADKSRARITIPEKKDI